MIIIIFKKFVFQNCLKNYHKFKKIAKILLPQIYTKKKQINIYEEITRKTLNLLKIINIIKLNFMEKLKNFKCVNLKISKLKF